MLLLAADTGETSVAAEFPFTIGRSPSAGMRLEQPGVWDIHASIRIQDGRFYVQPEGSALLLVNQERSDGAQLRLGDQLSIGAARVTISLAPAVQQRLAAREALNWLVIAAVGITQVLLLLAIR